jgi:ankyrin repeat protein
VLIEMKADLDIQDEDGWTALMYAAVEGHAALVSAIVKAGANKNVKNVDGRTAADLAEQRKYTEVIRALSDPYAGEADLANRPF